MKLVRRPQVALARRVRRRGVDLDAALSAVAPDIRSAMHEAARELRRLGIRHVLCGGIAVGAHGYPRATKDVDFLVGDEAFERHGPIVTLRAPFQVMGVAIDSVPIPEEAPFLAGELEPSAAGSEPGVISVGGLVFMKLLAGRKRDLADITELIKAGIDTEGVRRYLESKAAERVSEFEELILAAEREAE